MIEFPFELILWETFFLLRREHFFRFVFSFARVSTYFAGSHGREFAQIVNLELHASLEFTSAESESLHLNGSKGTDFPQSTIFFSAWPSQSLISNFWLTKMSENFENKNLSRNEKSEWIVERRGRMFLADENL